MCFRTYGSPITRLIEPFQSARGWARQALVSAHRCHSTAALREAVRSGNLPVGRRLERWVRPMAHAATFTVA
jgi:hypothetical protein